MTGNRLCGDNEPNGSARQPRAHGRRALVTSAALRLPLGSPGTLHADTSVPWRDYVANTLDTLIERGTDVYGKRKTPLLMSVIDVRTMDSPEKPELADSLIRYEGRLHRRGERGSNLWNDQPTLRAMYWLSQRTDERKYANAADAYIEYALKHCRKKNGLLAWGSHIHWDCYRDRAGGDGDGTSATRIPGSIIGTTMETLEPISRSPAARMC